MSPAAWGVWVLPPEFGVSRAHGPIWQCPLPPPPCPPWRRPPWWQRSLVALVLAGCRKGSDWGGAVLRWQPHPLPLRPRQYAFRPAGVPLRLLLPVCVRAGCELLIGVHSHRGSAASERVPPLCQQLLGAPNGCVVGHMRAEQPPLALVG